MNWTGGWYNIWWCFHFDFSSTLTFSDGTLKIGLTLSQYLENIATMVHSCNGIMIGELFRKWFFDYSTDSFLLKEKFYFLFPFLFALECLILRVTNQQWNIMFFCWFCVCHIIGSSCDDKYRTNHFRNLFVVTLRATFFQSM